MDPHRLVLGFDMANATLMAKNYGIIGNKAAIAINQAYAGHPGRLIKNATQTFVAATGHGANSRSALRHAGETAILEKRSSPLTN